MIENVVEPNPDQMQNPIAELFRRGETVHSMTTNENESIVVLE